MHIALLAFGSILNLTTENSCCGFPVFNKIKITSILLFFTTFFTLGSVPARATTTYLYDANGNMTSDGTNCYFYNDANQLSEVKNCSSNQVVAQYIYDSNGNRIAKKEYANGTLATTVYSPRDDYETVKTASNGATSNTTYYFANNQLLAKKNSDGSKNYYLSDHLGSATVIVDQNGNVVEATTYEPYGKVRTGGLASKYQYTGQEKDLETGLNYYNARYYNSDIAHFTQPDDVIPLLYNPQTLNRYSYVYNNPLTYVDPSGHFGDSDYNATGNDLLMDNYDFIRFTRNTNYINSSYYKEKVDTNIHAAEAIVNAEINMLGFTPIDVPGLDVIDALNGVINETLDNTKPGHLSNKEFGTMVGNSAVKYMQSKLNGGILGKIIPDGGSLVKKEAGAIAGKVGETILENTENTIYNKVVTTSSKNAANTSISQSTLSRAENPTYNFANTIKSNGFDLNFFRNNLKL
jgi:RHS repeat-associated protein